MCDAQSFTAFSSHGVMPRNWCYAVVIGKEQGAAKGRMDIAENSSCLMIFFTAASSSTLSLAPGLQTSTGFFFFLSFFFSFGLWHLIPSLFFWSSCGGRGQVTHPVCNRWLRRMQMPSVLLGAADDPRTSCDAAAWLPQAERRCILQVGGEKEQQHQRWQRMHKKRKMRFSGRSSVRTNI